MTVFINIKVAPTNVHNYVHWVVHN